VAVRLIAAAAALAALAAARGDARADDEDGPVRVSLPTESDREAWTHPGFRLALGWAYGRMVGLDGAPDGRLQGPILRTGVRLDADWSLLGSLQYTVASGGLLGLRFAGTIEPTWHVTRSISLALGLGFGGLVEGQARTGPEAPLGGMGGSYTFPDASPPLASCSGIGVATLARAEWMYVLGPRSSTGFAAEVGGQWTGCVEDTNRVEPDTAEAVVRRQFWPHVAWTLAWVVAWR
jgi:hypothetical protein